MNTDFLTSGFAKELPKTLASIDVTLKSILKLDKDRDIKSNNLLKEKNQDDKERETHSSKLEDLLEKILDKTGVSVKDNVKEKNKEFFSGLTDWGIKQLPNIMKTILPMIGSALSGLMAAAAPIASVAAPIVAGAAVVGGATAAAAKVAEDVGNKAVTMIGGKGVTKGGKTYNIENIQDARTEIETTGRKSGKSSQQIATDAKPYIEAVDRQKIYKSVNDDLAKNKKDLEDRKQQLESAKKTKPGEVIRLQKEVDELETKKKENEINKLQSEKKALTAFDKLDLKTVEKYRANKEEKSKLNFAQRLLFEVQGKELNPYDEGQKNADKINAFKIPKGPKGTPTKKATGGIIHVPGNQEGDIYPQKLQAGSFVLNKIASEEYKKNKFATGGLVQTLLEPGEIAFPPGMWHSGHAALNDAIPRFAEGGKVGAKPAASKPNSADEILNTLNTTKKLVSLGAGTCVTSVGRTLDLNHIPNPKSNSDGNHSRGYAIQLANKYGWISKGGAPTKMSGGDGSATLGVIPHSSFLEGSKSGAVPGGSIVISTKFPDWTGGSPSGHDTAIARRNGTKLFNGDNEGEGGLSIFGARTKSNIVMVPTGASSKGGFNATGEAGGAGSVVKSVLETITGGLGGLFAALGPGSEAISGAVSKVLGEFAQAAGTGADLLLGALFPGMAAMAGIMGGGNEPNASGGGPNASGGGPVGDMSGAGMEKAKKIKQQLIAKGYTEAAAAGLVANLYHESGGFSKFNQEGGGDGVGWAQWSGSRRNTFLNWAKANKLDPKSDAANFGYLMKEMDSNSGWVKKGANTETFKKMNDSVAAAKYFMDNFESPNPAYAHWDRRQQLAQQIAKLQQGGIVKARTGGIIGGDPFAILGGVGKSLFGNFGQQPEKKKAPPKKAPPKKTPVLSNEKFLLSKAKQRYKGAELAQFMGQTSVESDSFNTLSEYGGGYDSYSGGKKYKGRGYIQLTHDYNYKEFGKAMGVGDKFVKNPELIEKDRDLAAKASFWFWEKNIKPNIKDFSDTAAVTRIINGGDSHLDRREEEFKKYKKMKLQTGGVVKAQTGGLIPGSGDGDKVPLKLQAGSFVMNKKAAKALMTDEVRLQSGGIANAPSPIHHRFAMAQEKFSENSQSPIIIVNNNQSDGGGKQSISLSANGSGPIPTLGNPRASDYWFRDAMGGVM